MHPVYFDPNPIYEFNFDYDVSGVRSGVFTWYDAARTGIYYLASGLTSDYRVPPSSGLHITGSEVSKPDCLSVSYTSYPTYNSVALEYDGRVYAYNSSFVEMANFSGFYPRFMNFAGFGATGVFCLYQKSGDIFYRRFSESFSTERKLTNRGDILRPTYGIVKSGNYFELYCEKTDLDLVVYKMKK